MAALDHHTVQGLCRIQIGMRRSGLRIIAVPQGWSRRDALTSATSVCGNSGLMASMSSSLSIWMSASAKQHVHVPGLRRHGGSRISRSHTALGERVVECRAICAEPGAIHARSPATMTTEYGRAEELGGFLREWRCARTWAGFLRGGGRNCTWPNAPQPSTFVNDRF